MHSQPKYPFFIGAGDIQTPDMVWGQIFVCINLNTEGIGAIKDHLVSINASIYERKGPLLGLPDSPKSQTLKFRGGVEFD